MKGWINCVISRIKEETHDTKTMTLSLEKDFLFLPGQFVMLGFDHGPHKDDMKAARAYSISSSPSNPREIEITFRLYKEGLFTPLLFNSKVSDKMKIKGPYGGFNYREDDGNNLVFLSAGSGIAPIKSMIEYFLDSKDNAKIQLIYVDKTKDDLIYRNIFEKLDESGKAVVIFSLTREKWNGDMGRIDMEKIDKLDISEETMFYICGPPTMVNETVNLLRKKGVTASKIKTEKYD